MKYLIPLLLVANVAFAAPIKHELPAGSTTDVAHVYMPTGELDEDGDPLSLPAASIAILDRWTDEILACVSIQSGEEKTFEYPLPPETRPKTWGRAYSQPDCTGAVSEASFDWYIIWVGDHPMKPELR
jgi:hypothetical protein